MNKLIELQIKYIKDFFFFFFFGKENNKRHWEKEFCGIQYPLGREMEKKPRQHGVE